MDCKILSNECIHQLFILHCGVHVPEGAHIAQRTYNCLLSSALHSLY